MLKAGDVLFTLEDKDKITVEAMQAYGKFKLTKQQEGERMQELQLSSAEFG